MVTGVSKRLFPIKQYRLWRWSFIRTGGGGRFGFVPKRGGDDTRLSSGKSSPSSLPSSFPFLRSARGRNGFLESLNCGLLRGAISARTTGGYAAHKKADAKRLEL